MRVVFLGTGDAFNSGGRLFTSVLVDGSLRILLDCGPHVIYALERLHCPIDTISYVLITHLHGDHAGGLPFLRLNLTHKKRGRLTLIGPEGLERFVDETYARMFKVRDTEDAFRIETPEARLPFGLSRLEGVHPVPAYVYRLEIDGRSIVYTGDTAKVDLSRFARGADLLIHEASSLSPEAGEFGHSTPFEAAEVAAAAGVKRLALVHSPGFPPESERRVKSIFPATVFPNDLEELDV